jgi:hypothetical protein
VTRGLVVLLLAAVLAVSAAAQDGGEQPVLALVSQGTKAELVRLDPVSLVPVAGVPRLPLGAQDIPWAQSPDGSLLAIGSGRSTSLVFVDLRSMQALGRIGTAFMTALAWPAPRRLLLLEHTGRRWRLAIIDPEARRVLSRTKLGSRGDVAAAATTRDGLAVLMMPGARVGTPWLLLLEADGRARRVALPRIAAGREKKRLGERYRFWYRNPGLAVDSETGIAYVVTAGPRAAEIDLATLAVSYRDVHFVRDRSAAGRSPVTASVTRSGGNVLSTGTLRQAHWLGNGLIAIAGWNARIAEDGAGHRVQSDQAAGLSVLDTRDWTQRRLLDDARWFHATTDLILARTSPQRRPGTALAGFTHEGAARFRVELDTVSFGVQTAGPYAYLALGDAYRPHLVTVVDTRTGQPAGTPRAPGWVLLVSPSQPQFCRCYTGTTVD